MNALRWRWVHPFCILPVRSSRSASQKMLKPGDPVRNEAVAWVSDQCLVASTARAAAAAGDMQNKSTVCPVWMVMLQAEVARQPNLENTMT